MKKFLLGIGLFASIGLFMLNSANAQLLQGSGLSTNATTDTSVLSVNCYNGDNTEPCTTYTTTNAGKIGTIKVNINGVTGYIDVKAGPV